MCGLAGYSGLKNVKQRTILAWALGIGIDKRGGHAAGFVSVDTASSGKGIRTSKRIGPWEKAKTKFIYAAGAGEVAMLHSRFATCGKWHELANAHPFVIKRKDEAVLYGVHNGVVGETVASAKLHGREYSVDSKEVFELLADGNMKAIQDLDGYGVLNWITPDSGVVNLAKLSAKADFIACTLVGGGIAWASTWEILSDALDVAKLRPENTLITDEVGRVYQLTPQGVVKTSETGVKVGKSAWERRWEAGKKEHESRYDHQGFARDGEWWNDYAGAGMGAYGSGMYDHEGERKAREQRLDNWRKEQNKRTSAYFAKNKDDKPLAYGFKLGERFTNSQGVSFERQLAGWEKVPDTETSFSAGVRDARAIEGMLKAGVKDESLGERPTEPSIRVGVPVGPRVIIVDDTADKRGTGDDSWEAMQQQHWKRKKEASDACNLRLREAERVERGRAAPLDLESMTDEDLEGLTEADWEAICDTYRDRP